ncbi:MAG: hypothetical protein QOI47_1455 [Actinomycetota bacterium]|nr:hypothetical protein [Actinomycetota bacterium]
MTTNSVLPAPAVVADAPRAPFVSPITPGNKPTPVAGDTNGQMPPEHLVNVAPGCQAARDAAPSLGLLLATARERGISLGTEQCYRPLSDQVAVRQTWTGAGNSSCAAPVATSSSGAPKGTSMHGWGKASDFSEPGAGVEFGSPGYRFLVAEAGHFGWNHPGWARPGGSSCPEAWHWEWVGDGGVLHASPVPADVVAVAAGHDGRSYSQVTGLGAISGFGAPTGPVQDAIVRLAWLVVGAARTPDDRGLWLVSSDGGVFTVGDAAFFGSKPAQSPTRPAVGIAATPQGDGYWVVATDGTITAFGAAREHGSPAKSTLARPIVGIAATPTGRGYWLAAADGEVFAYGDATTFDAATRSVSNAPVVAIAATPTGRGYWLARDDGAVSAFGDAASVSPSTGTALAEPIVGITPTPTGRGYWLAAADGGIFAYGDARYLGHR